MSQVYPFKTKQELTDMFYNIAFEEIVRDCLPKPQTIESFIMIGGESVLSETFFYIAREFFPDSTVIMCNCHNRDYILIPDQHIIFDIYFYYFNVPIDNEFYSSLYSEFSSEYDSTSTTDSF
jgi:hypothetical protein